MEPNPSAEQQRRGTCLTMTLTGGFAVFLLLVLVLATGGWAAYILWVGGFVALFGLIHYLLWGRLLLRQTAGERQEEDVRRRIEEREDDEPRPGANGIRRFP
ncbi:MAG TPA: hypothetical protein VMS17_00075 [Gemmataceae bacterium]|nr:hypothetical protein [Gemmataceae bacterium]